MNSNDYRSTLGGVAPSPAWRERTLAAMKQAQGQKRPSRKPLAIAATAAVLAVAVTGGVWLSGRIEVDPDGPGTARTPEPVVTPTPTIDPEWIYFETFSIVTDPSQLMGNNPTAGRLEELTELPVYQNPIPTERDQRAALQGLAADLGLTIAHISDFTWRPSTGEDTMGRSPTLTAECTDGTKLRLEGFYSLQIYDSPDLAAMAETARSYLLYSAMTPEEMLSSSSVPPQTGQETLETYAYTGEADVTQATFLLDQDATPEEQIYSYSFQRMEVRNTSLTLYLQPGASVGTYPLRSPDDALDSFRSWDYWGSSFTYHPEDAQIIFVSLEYDISMGQPYFQPVYRILFTQDYWDMADRMFDGVDPSPFMGVGVAYVPAIDPKYQDEVPYRRYFNDGLAHHIPEELA